MKYKIINKDNEKYIKTHVYSDDWSKSSRHMNIIYGTFEESIFFHNLKDCKKYLDLIKNKGDFKIVKVKEELYEKWLNKFINFKKDIRERAI